MELLSNNLAEALVIMGLAILAIEVVVLGFSTFVLFFVGLACIVTGALMFAGAIPEIAMYAYVSVAVLTAALACLLWKPLKKLQNKVEHKTVKSDLIGLSFILEGDVSSSKNSSHDYSGITWKVKSADALAAGTEVEVVKTEVGAFTVAAKTG